MKISDLADSEMNFVELTEQEQINIVGGTLLAGGGGGGGSWGTSVYTGGDNGSSRGANAWSVLSWW